VDHRVLVWCHVWCVDVPVWMWMDGCVCVYMYVWVSEWVSECEHVSVCAGCVLVWMWMCGCVDVGVSE
jgi:hypothetical protein